MRVPSWNTYLFPGWQMTCTAYCVKIEEIFDAMIRLSSEVLPENRMTVNNYIDGVWKLVTPFVRSIEREEGTEDLGSKFKSYVDSEESRLRQNLEDISYRIDSPATVRVVAGEGRFETVIDTVLVSVFYAVLTRSSPLGPFPVVLSRFEEGFGKDQSCSETCPF